jgi:hypothetical protein
LQASSFRNIYAVSIIRTHCYKNLSVIKISMILMVRYLYTGVSPGGLS